MKRLPRSRQHDQFYEQNQTKQRPSDDLARFEVLLNRRRKPEQKLGPSDVEDIATPNDRIRDALTVQMNNGCILRLDANELAFFQTKDCVLFKDPGLTNLNGGIFAPADNARKAGAGIDLKLVPRPAETPKLNHRGN